jgi:hypothetical protein
MGASKIRFTPKKLKPDDVSFTNSRRKGETWLYPEKTPHKIGHAMGMETFKRLRDGPQGQPKKNIAAVTLFSLAANAARKMVRWVIDQDGKLHAGDGFFLIHMDIVQSWGAQKYKGWIDLEKKYYAVASVEDGVVRNVDPHMVTDKMVQRIVKWAEQKGLRLDREQVFEAYMGDVRLDESYDEIKRKKIAYTQILDFVKNLPRKFARFVITPDDKIYISDGHKYIHYQIATGDSDHLDLPYTESNNKWMKNVKWAGVVSLRYEEEKFFALSKVDGKGNYSWRKDEKYDGKAKLLADFLMKHGFQRQVEWDV